MTSTTAAAFLGPDSAILGPATGPGRRDGPGARDEPFRCQVTSGGRHRAGLTRLRALLRRLTILDPTAGLNT